MSKATDIAKVEQALADKAGVSHNHDSAYAKIDGSNTGGFGLKNRIINGAMTVAQRGSLTNASGALQSCDRWMALADGTVTRFDSQNLPEGGVPTWPALALTISRTGGAVVYIRQRIEASFIADLADGKVSIQARFYHNAGVPLSVLVEWSLPNAVDNYSSTTYGGGAGTVVAANNAWTDLKWENVTLPTGARNGVELNFTIMTPATLTNTAIYIRNVQLEAGPKCTPFERRPVGLELSLCQRYFQRLGGFGNYSIIGNGFVSSGSAALMPHYPTVPFRTSPSITAGSQTAFQVNDGSFSAVTTAVGYDQGTHSGRDVQNLLFTTNVGLTIGRVARICGNNSASCYIDFFAEL